MHTPSVRTGLCETRRDTGGILTKNLLQGNHLTMRPWGGGGGVHSVLLPPPAPKIGGRSSLRSRGVVDCQLCDRLFFYFFFKEITK